MKKLLEKPYVYVISFVLPIVLTLIVMAIRDIWPMGSKSLLLWDMEIQYIHIYNWYHSVLHGDANIFYDFSKSLGGNMYGIFATYLASPINILIYFFPIEKMIFFIAISTLFKIGLSGLFAYIYLKERFGTENNRMWLLLSLSYALMEYNVGLCSNLHFLDVIYILPILALGVYRLIEQNKKIVFIISVGYSIICSWYIGYMACLFIAFYFIFELVLGDRKNWKKNVLRFFYCALIGGMLGCVTLLPTLLATQNGKGSLSFDMMKKGFHCNFLEPLKGLLVSEMPNTTYESPAIFVGSLSVVLVIMGLFSSKIQLKKKIAVSALLLIVYLSFVFVPLEVIWSALKKTYSFHFRNSFVFSFALIASAGLFYSSDTSIVNKRGVIGSLIVLASYFLYACYKQFITVDNNILYIVLVIFYIFIFPNDKKSKINNLKWVLLTILLFTELGINASLDFNKYSITCKEYSDYVIQMKSALATLPSNENDFYRMEKTISEMDRRRGESRPVATEGLTFNYNPLTHYSSLIDSPVDYYLYHSGYNNAENKFSNYVSSNPVMDSILGVKYLYDDKKVALLKEEDKYEICGEEIKKYDNEYALRLVTSVSKTSKVKWVRNPFVNQKRILSDMIGYEADVFNKYSYKKNKNGSWIVDVTSDGPVYIYMNRKHQDTALYVNGEFVQNYFGRFYNNVCYIGDYKSGERIEIFLKNDSDPDAKHNLYVFGINEENYKSILNSLKANSFNPDQICDGKITFSHDSDHDENLLITIPVDSGWKTKVDGKIFVPDVAYDTFYVISLPSGNHLVEMKYTPPYLGLGCILSVLGLIACVVIFICEKQSDKMG